MQTSDFAKATPDAVGDCEAGGPNPLISRYQKAINGRRRPACEDFVSQNLRLYHNF